MAQPQRKESQPRSVGHESIDGTLSESVLQFDLAKLANSPNCSGMNRGCPPRGEVAVNRVHRDSACRCVLVHARIRLHRDQHNAEIRVLCKRLRIFGFTCPGGWWISRRGTCSPWISAFLMMWRSPRTALFC